MKVGRESGSLFGCSLVVRWLFSSFHRRSSDRIEQLENENRQLKDRQPPVSAGLPLRPGASIFHPSASAASAAPAAAPTATSTPMENRAFGMAGAGPFPPSSGADPFPSSSVRPRPVHGWTGIGVNAPAVQPPSAWFAGVKLKVDRLLIILGEAPLKPDPLVTHGQRLEWNRNLVVDWLIVGTFLAGLGR